MNVDKIRGKTFFKCYIGLSSSHLSNTGFLPIRLVLMVNAQFTIKKKSFSPIFLSVHRAKYIFPGTYFATGIGNQFGPWCIPHLKTPKVKLR